MNISELSVRRPVTITMVYVLICVIAAVFVPRLGIALFPSTTLPIISVSASYPNVGPEEIDENVTKVLVNRLTSVSGLKKISSSSATGSGYITLEFGYDRDMEDALSDVQNVISNVARSLPDDCSTPTARKFDMNSMPFMRLAIQGNLQRNELKALAEDTVQPLLERIDGVASTSVNGGSARQIKADVSQNRLEAYGLPLSSITSALSSRNVQLSGGSLTQNNRKYEVVTDAYYTSLDEIRETVLKTYGDGSVLRLSDVANVYEHFDTKSRKVFINGVPGLYISVSNESDANITRISREVYEQLPVINAQLPEGVTLEVVSDDTTMIDSTMTQVYQSAFQGIMLAMAIIFLFLRSFKSAVIIGMAIPISVLITLMVMAIMDLTVNMMTMSGLILALGMTVDSSIVILENIQIYRIRGEKSTVAAILGSRNMLNAIVASTLTTLCVFIPMLIYKAELEMLGQMFYELVITVCVAMTASLFVAVTLVPALCGSILRLDTRTQKPLRSPLLIKIDSAVECGIRRAEDVYARTLNWALRNRFLVLTAVALAVILSVMRFSSMGISFSPRSESDDQLTVSITLPVGTDNDVVLERLFEFQEIILEKIGGNYKNIILNSGTANSGDIQINLPPLEEQKMSPADMKKAITPYLSRWPDANITFSAGRRMGGSSSGINIEILSDDALTATFTADSLVALLKEKIPQLENIDTDLENGSPKYDIVIDYDTAGFYGVSVSAIASTLRTAVTGTTATVFYENGSEYDVIVCIDENDLSSMSDITTLTVSTNAGLMTLDNFVTLREGRSPQAIRRENKQRINHVTADIRTGFTAGEIEPLVKECIQNNFVVPDSVTLNYSGETADIEKFGGTFIIVIVLAVFLVFAVMAAQFESLVDPFIIFTSIPLLLIGVVAVYTLMGQSFSMYSIVGIVALVGVVVNNGIVLVDYTNQLTRRKTPVFDACLEAGRSRFRPILMTTLTTVLGMIPMGFFPGDGGEQMQPIGMTFVGGLSSAAVLTLYVSPIMYSLFNKRREKRFDDPDSLMNQLAQKLPEN